MLKIQKPLTLLWSYGLMLLCSYGLMVRVSAQKSQNELSIYGEGGLALFCTQPKLKGFTSIGYGCDAGIGFTGFFTPRWGIHVGAGLGYFHVKNSIKNLTYITKQDDCGIYDLYTALNNFQETHKAVFVSVPLMIQFQTKMSSNYWNWKKSKRVGFYAKAGAKAQFLIHYNCTSEIELLNNAAYYPELDSWIYTLPDFGLGIFNNINSFKNNNFSIVALLATEAGLKWRIGKNHYLYTGAYFDYGLNDFTNKNREDAKTFVLSLSEEKTSLLKFTRKMNLMVIGLKLRLAFVQIHKKESCY